MSSQLFASQKRYIPRSSHSKVSDEAMVHNRERARKAAVRRKGEVRTGGLLGFGFGFCLCFKALQIAVTRPFEMT